MALKDDIQDELKFRGEQALDQLDQRGGLVEFHKWFLLRNVPKGLSWLHTLGFCLLIVFVNQAVTGSILAMHYQPGADTAYESIQRITMDFDFGWLVRGMHKWGASLMIVLMFLHMGASFMMGAYKYPRELTWISGVLIFATLSQVFTLNNLSTSVQAIIKGIIIVVAVLLQQRFAARGARQT